MEVLVVTVLIDAGVVTASVFSALILVAVFCTVLAMPLTRLIIVADGIRDVTLGSHLLGLRSSPAKAAMLI